MTDTIFDVAADTQRAWTGLVSASRRMQDRIEARLKAEGLPPLGWYDALLEIERAGPDGLRPLALTRRLLLPQYGISRLLDRIENAGLVERRRAPADARGQIVAITEAGAALRARMWPVYAAEMRAGIEDRLTAQQIATLAGLLARLHGAETEDGGDKGAQASDSS